ncbi:hypothetical protein Bcav_1433 [Beutenbergia cavernae DSM 12333]|uniref:DUF4185 domain-containing protein n=1 Tax=Beutenbergia cavernae (strain ATCC BAA-8 / DSM 12333 / CCUG 43141 / JCM 11478 / NBRC 16432 / NCIMB 13614 / HKI 0122) TaxID=471853 RepID=C5C2K5_BEUC1|nr:DUF4185 domain-containing protein [Beutenbergia cavernae]ACQ79691.1 hypothetical protein Bcav_1433 [Beutenbergia cavernae DSM 12333]
MSLQDSPLVASVRDLGVQFADNDVGITGQDAVSSVRLSDGTTFWIFGDTIEGPFDSIRGFELTEVLSNTGAIVPMQDISNGVREFRYLTDPQGTRARQLINFLPPEHKATQRLWAIHGTQVADQLYLYYHRITMDPERDVFETFQLDGMGVARAAVPDYQFERLPALDGSQEWWKGDEPGFGVWVQRHDEHLYLWGSIQPESKSAGDMYLARVRPDDIEDLAAYSYLVEAPTRARPDVTPRWSPTFAPTACLFDDVPNEMSSSWNEHLGAFISLTTFRRDNVLVIRTAPELTGPWSEPQVVYRPERTRPESLYNAGKEHPEFAREGGKVTYMTFIDSSVYRPHLIEITLA